MKQDWNLSISEVISKTNTSLTDGLSTIEAETRLKKYGLNQLQEKKGRSPLIIFLSQFQDFIIWVLFSAALISGFLREWVDAIVIISIIILNAILGFIQEHKAEKSLIALKKLSFTNAKVLRDKKYNDIRSTQLVFGDIVNLNSGDKIPADCRIIWQTSNFKVEESTLTGESEPVIKDASTLEKERIPLAERKNIIYMGTSVHSGKATAVVTKTGMETELGKIAVMTQKIEKETTPLQKKMEEFSKRIVLVCFFLVSIVFLLQWLRGGNIADVFLTSVSLAVAAIPEGLPAVITIILALSVQQMIKRNVIIRKLPSIETLGCTTVICSDKTGTLTKNEMTVRAIFSNKNVFNLSGVGYNPQGEYSVENHQVDTNKYPLLKKILQVSVLCNDAQLIEEDNTYRIVGDPTEGALLTAAAKAQIWKEQEEKEFRFVDEIPFDSERKKMTVIRENNGQIFAFTKGAPEKILQDCNYFEENGQLLPLTNEGKESLLEQNSEFTKKAMRVLGISYKNLKSSYNPHYKADIVEKDMVFLGLIGMHDPPRPEAKEAITKCKQAGIKTVMITGDHKNTAVAIAQELGLMEEGFIALSGEEIDKLSEKDLIDKIEDISVYARVSSEHKIKIVKMWRKRGEVVAMTGDGVNDAPAVKEADIGISMGITGTDVTKEVSDMVITDDNFASIVAAVEEGRGIYDNIKKFVHYLLSCNAGEIMVMLAAALVKLPPPLLPIHILWVNLVTDGLPALALGFEPVDKNIMERKPRNPTLPLISGKTSILILMQGVLIAICSLLAYIFILKIEKGSIERARTGAFVVLACSQLFHSFNCRNSEKSIFQLGIFSNIKLVFATFTSFLLQILVVSFPFTRKIFKTASLGTLEWFIILGISTFPLIVTEIYKTQKRRDLSSQQN